jgi:hypothetical protein
MSSATGAFIPFRVEYPAACGVFILCQKRRRGMRHGNIIASYRNIIPRGSAAGYFIPAITMMRAIFAQEEVRFIYETLLFYL